MASAHPEVYALTFLTRSGEWVRLRLVGRSSKEAVAQAAAFHGAIAVVTTVGGETTPVSEFLLR